METTVTVFTRRRAVALGLSAAALPSSLSAQAAWPTGPVTFVVGCAPGGSNDINARELAALMSPILGQQIIVDNKAGANRRHQRRPPSHAPAAPRCTTSVPAKRGGGLCPNRAVWVANRGARTGPALGCRTSTGPGRTSRSEAGGDSPVPGSCPRPPSPRP